MSDMTKVYLVETGVLLKEDYPDYNAYNVSYDKKHGFYDEGQYYSLNFLPERENALKEVENGVPWTYAIISETCINSEALKDLREDYVPVENEDYLPENVVFSAYKDEEGEIHYNFIEGQRLTDTGHLEYTTTPIQVNVELGEYDDFNGLDVSDFETVFVNGFEGTDLSYDITENEVSGDYKNISLNVEIYTNSKDKPILVSDFENKFEEVVNDLDITYEVMDNTEKEMD